MAESTWTRAASLNALAAGLNRFLNARLKRRQAQRSVYQAMKFVARDG